MALWVLKQSDNSLIILVADKFISAPEFSGHSYIALPTLTNAYSDLQLSMEFRQVSTISCIYIDMTKKIRDRLRELAEVITQPSFIILPHAINQSSINAMLNNSNHPQTDVARRYPAPDRRIRRHDRGLPRTSHQRRPHRAQVRKYPKRIFQRYSPTRLMDHRIMVQLG